jgi:hypothetical protein
MPRSFELSGAASCAAHFETSMKNPKALRRKWDLEFHQLELALEA